MPIDAQAWPALPAQLCWRRGGLSDQKTQMSLIIRVEKLSFWGSASKIHDVAGTPRLAVSIVPTSGDVIEQLQKDYHKCKIKQKFMKSPKKHETPRS